MNKSLALLPLIAVLVLTDSAPIRADEPSSTATLEEAARLMTGSFSSAEQAAADESYFDIRLEMVRIWPDRDDGPWLYVEQAAASALARPYRQRVYRLSLGDDGVLESRVYSISGDPLRFAGAWESSTPLAEIGPDDLEVRKGCSVFLSRDGEAWSGATDAKKCESVLRGATYATSEVIVHDDRILSWDRGFNDADEQVWGATEGGYVFLRTDG